MGQGAIAAVSSDGESFGRRSSKPFTAASPSFFTDFPHGPGELISHGRDGLLVPLEGGADVYAAALLQLIEEDERRTAMGAAAIEKAAAYDPAHVAARYVEQFQELRKA